MAAAVACHCTMCRRQSGHFWVSTNVAEADLAIEGADSLVWHRSSEVAERGFCGKCGSFLFWRRPGSGRIAVSMGSLDLPTGVVLDRHIFVAEKSDYYEIEDEVKQFEGDD
ncbi:aldehyde-activating protein [Kaistia algarum]|nr:aldehyde-activating protein [Kaistia algarum]